MYPKLFTLIAKWGWYPKILKLEYLTGSKIINNCNCLLSLRLLKTKPIALVFIIIRSLKFISFSTFFFLKLFNLTIYLAKYNKLYHQLKWTKKKWKMKKILNSRYRRRIVKKFIDWVWFIPEKISSKSAFLISNSA